MKKYIFLFFAVCAFSVYANAQNRTGDCTSYTSDDRSVTFYLNDSSAIQLRLCSQSTVRIWFSPDGSFQRNNPSFAVVNEDLEDVGTVHVDEQNACYEIFTPKLRIRVNKSPFNLQIFDKYQKLLFSDYADKGHISNGQRKLEYKTLRRDEHFFGLGEKTGKLDRRGEAYKMWNSDKPCYSAVEDPLYKSIPFFMSSYRYGIFLDNTYKTEFKFGTESRDYYSFEAPGGEMIYYFIFGKDYKEIMKQYVDLTGKPIMPPKWALGFAQCRGLLTSEKLSYEIAEGYRKRGIPCDVIYQDIGWTQYLQDFEWRKGNYENPKKMLADLKDMGFKVVVSQDPVISQANKRQWEEADRLGYLVKDSTNGRSYDMPWPWGGNCGVVDFTLPAVADWWGAYQQKPIDDGIAGFWTDMGEPAWSNEEQTERLVMKHHLGMHDEIHNVYGNPLSRIHHEGNVAVEPWLFGEEAEKNAKAAIELKYRLLPYIYTYAREAHETGLPLMRPMFLEYPADMETFSTDAQFMFGSELLVAPVVKKGARNKNVYLPEGTWIDYNNKHTAYSGEQWMTVDAPLNTIPMFVKQGSIIPQMPVMNYTDEKPVYPVTFEIFPAAAGSETTFSLYEDAGTDLGYLRGEFMRTPITCQTTDKGYTLKVGTRTGEKYSLPGQRNLMFCIYTEQMPKTALLDGQKIKKTNVGKLEENRETEFTITAWCPDKKQGTCLLRLPDDGKEHIIEFVY